jgi:hypothetical protein
MSPLSLKPSPLAADAAKKQIPISEMQPEVGHFQKQWIDAAKSGKCETACDFEYSSKMIETMMLGLVAYRAGDKIAYNGATGKCDTPEATAFLSKKYRDGWTLDG